MGSLSKYRRSAGAVRRIGWHIVWCPKYRKHGLVGRVPDRFRELLLAKAAARRVEALDEATIRKYLGDGTTGPIRGKP